MNQASLGDSDRDGDHRPTAPRSIVAAFGSQAIGVIDTAALALDPNDPNAYQPSAASHIPLSAGGPGGLVLDEQHYRLYVYTRFDDGVSVVDAVAHTELAHLSVHNPEPRAITVGRRFLYDTQLLVVERRGVVRRLPRVRRLRLARVGSRRALARRRSGARTTTRS